MSKRFLHYIHDPEPFGDDLYRLRWEIVQICSVVTEFSRYQKGQHVSVALDSEKKD